MNPDLESLKSLQEVDREILRLQEEIAALPRRVAVIEAKLADSKAQLESHKGALKNTELARRNLEHEIQGEQQKISKYREQSLDVKTNEQYKALMHEVEFADRNIRACEDKILQSMEDAEGHERAMKATEGELKAESAEIEKEKAEARARSEADEKELAEWTTKRNQLRAKISPDVLENYDRVVAVRKTGLAEARDQKCSGCNVMLRPQKYDELRGNQHIITCESCGRILFYDPAHEAPPAAPPKGRRKKAEAAGETPEASALESGPQVTTAH
jgi:uncharacterized protein